MRTSAAENVTELASVDDIARALRRAPVVPLTDEERALLAELDERPVRWIAHEQFVAGLPTHDRSQ